MRPPTVLQVNQVRCELPPAAGQANLLQVLRNDLQLNGPKYGCGLGECGSCTVWVDGVAARACVIPARGVAGRGDGSDSYRAKGNGFAVAHNLVHLYASEGRQNC